MQEPRPTKESRPDYLLALGYWLLAIGYARSAKPTYRRLTVFPIGARTLSNSWDW
jgi:hypothetical protein